MRSHIITVIKKNNMQPSIQVSKVKNLVSISANPTLMTAARKEVLLNAETGENGENNKDLGTNLV